MSWESNLIGESKQESGVEKNIFDTPSNKTESIVGYVKMSNNELIERLEGILDSLKGLEELKEIEKNIEEVVKNIEEVVKDVYSDYIDVKKVLLNRNLEGNLDLRMKDIDDKLWEKFKKLGIQQDKETLDQNRQQ